MLDLRDFISGFYVVYPVRDSMLGMRLDRGIEPTNLGHLAWLWIKNIIKGGFDNTCGRLTALSVSVGKPYGQLGYNAQYPYLQKALRTNLGNNSIVVYDGAAPSVVVVMPTLDESTIIISGGTIVYPINAYILPPFVIHSDSALSDESRSRIGAVATRLKFAGVRFVIDAPYPAQQPSVEVQALDELERIIQQ